MVVTPTIIDLTNEQEVIDLTNDTEREETPPPPYQSRILSIDCGRKNLAFAIVEQSGSNGFKILDWQLVDLELGRNPSKQQVLERVRDTLNRHIQRPFPELILIENQINFASRQFRRVGNQNAELNVAIEHQLRAFFHGSYCF